MGKIGFRIPDVGYGYDIEEIVAISQRAESLGYDSLWHPENMGRDVFMVLAKIAEHTDTIRLSSGITPVYARVPSQLAMAVGTLDELSGGRANLGIGASSWIHVENWYGIDYDRPLRRIRETIEIVNQAVHNEQVSYDGELFQINNYKRRFQPVQDHIPIYNAAIGPTNRKLTAEFADGWLPAYMPQEKLYEYADEIRNHAEDCGRDPDEIVMAPYIFACVSEDSDQAKEVMKRAMAYIVGGLKYYSKIYTEQYGYGDIVNHVQEAWDNNEREEAAKRIPDHLLESTTITGTPSEGQAKLREYQDAGIDLPIVYPPRAPKELIDETLEWLAPVDE